jgi:hypothetical protein
LLSIATFGITKFLHPTQPRASPALAPHRSLAILSLENPKQGPKNDFLGFSLADAKLDYVNSPTVRPSTAIEKYRNQVIDIQRLPQT